MEIYAELKEWQVGIGAFMGLIALSLAALLNFYLNRRRDAALREAEMLSVASAFYGEILLMREELALVAKIVARYETQGEDVPERFAEDYVPPDPTLYPVLAHKLGLLPPELILAITRFHASFQKAKESMALISRKDEIRFSILTLLEPALLGIEEVVPALREIERLADLPKAEHPDVGYAAHVREMEQHNIDSQFPPSS